MLCNAIASNPNILMMRGEAGRRQRLTERERWG
uniref:Uncharacterized protein n=1 Tax=Rhizophora mucronata TaxID=61149 RepID=A0A2P2IH11_RHIMU